VLNSNSGIDINTNVDNPLNISGVPFPKDYFDPGKCLAVNADGDEMEWVDVSRWGGDYNASTDSPALESTQSGITGSITPNGTTSVTGSGTAFTSEIAAGDGLLVNGEWAVVIEVFSDTSLSVNVAFTAGSADTSPEKAVQTATEISAGKMFANVVVGEFYGTILNEGDVIINQFGVNHHLGDWFIVRAGEKQVPDALTGTSETLSAYHGNAICQMNNASANTLTVPPNSSVPFSIGTTIDVVQMGAGTTTIAAGSGVTINKPSTLAISAQYGVATLRKIATDTWLANGDLT
jgi:hypothetical protein